jgi:hypothetical protein
MPVLAQKTYTLQFSPKLGQTYHFLTKMSGKAKLAIGMSMKATSVDDQKVVTEMRFDDISMDDKPLQGAEALQNLILTITEDRLGHVQDLQVAGGPPDLGQALKNQSSGASATFPDHPIKVGDTWAGDWEAQGIKGKATYKLVEVKTVNSILVGSLEISVELQDPKVKFKGPVKMDIEMDTGLPIQASLRISSAGQTQSMVIVRN